MLGLGGGVHSASWKFSLPFVHIFRTDWNFSTKFGSSDPSFNWHCYTWNLKYLHMRKLQLFIATYYYKFLDMISTWNLHWGHFLKNDVGQWFYQVDRVTFSKNVFWSVNFCPSVLLSFFYVQKSTLWLV